ncbi:MAG: hypothetical protein HUU10_06420 [Bacteroidetes bacterium]|nr:hypothetical protein [Bacteroidota bacterium]
MAGSVSLACDLKEPVGPTWTLKGAAPLFNGEFGVAEMLESADSSIRTENQRIFWVKSLDLNRTELSDSVKVDDRSIRGTQLLDSLSLDQFKSDTLSLKGTDLNANLQPGTINLSTQVTFSKNNLGFSGLDNFEYGIFNPDQSISFFIRNTFPFNIILTSLTLSNGSGPNPTFFSRTDTLRILPGRTRQLSIAIGGKRIQSNLKLDIAGRTNAPGVVTIDPEDGLEFFINGDDLYVTEARGRFKTPEYKSERVTDVGMEDFQPSLIRVGAGRMKYRINNQSAITGTIFITIPEMKKGTTAFTESINFPGNAVDTGSFVLTGFDIRPDGFPLTPVIRTQITYQLNTGTSFVTLKETDSIGYQFTISGIEPVYLEGNFNERATFSGFDTTTIKWPQDLRDISLEFDEASIVASINNSIGLKAEVTPRIIFTRPSGQDDSLMFSSGTFPIKIDAATPGIRVQKTVKSLELADVLNFNQVLNAKPTQVRYGVDAVGARGSNQSGFLYDTSSVSGSLKIKMPLRFKSTTGYEKDTLAALDIHSVKGLQEALLRTEYKNRLPYSVSYSLTFTDKDTIPLFRLPDDNTANSFVLGAAPVAADSPTQKGGYAIGYTQSVLPTSLTHEQIQKMEQAAFVRIVLRLTTTAESGPSAGYSEVREDDHLILRVSGQMKYKVNDE